MKKCLMAGLVGAFMLGCTTADPYTGEERTSRASAGATVGAIGGAVAGGAASSRGDRRRGILTGALVGGAIGGGVGHYMDRQERALREQLEGTGVRVEREGDTINLVMPGNITFAVNRHEIRDEFYETLDSVALVLQEYDQTAIQISGHTDSTGGAALNQTLSERRAGRVADYLIEQEIAPARVETYGYGPRYPVASNDTAEGRQANRRVELQLVPLPM